MINIGNTEVINIYIGDTPATAVYIGDTQIWGVGGKDYSTEYFTLSALESGTFTWGTTDVEYSLNDGAWTTWDDVNGLSVSADDKVRFRSTNTSYSGLTIGATGNFDVEGNIMSLLYGNNFENQTTLPSSNRLFYRFFANNQKLKNAKNLILPPTTLKQNCYSYFFHSCSALETAPELPATTLAAGCYSTMFGNCASLTKTPELPAVTIPGSAYNGMFGNCTSLTTAPALCGTTFTGESCYASMFAGCSSLAIAPELPVTTLTNGCYQGMFGNCTSLTTAPVLPATTLKMICYKEMFKGCSNINYIKCLATDITAWNCLQNWTNGVSTTGTFVKDANMTSWPTGTSGIPDNWTTIDA